MRRLALLLAVAACSGGTTTKVRDAEVDASADAQEADAAAPYDLVPFDHARIGSQGGQPNFQQVNAPIDLGPGPFASVTLIADLDSTCYPFTKWAADPPPAGQNWPADCDAFDRNFEFTLDEPAPAGAPPAIEPVRSITPFGGPEHLEV